MKKKNTDPNVLNTKFKQVEEYNEFLAMSVQQSSEGIAYADLDGNLIFINKAWCEMHGYKSDKNLLGKNLEIFHNKKQLINEVIPFNDIVMKNGNNRGEVWHVTKDGKTFPTLMTANLLKDENGIPFALVAFAKDITVQKKFDEKLKESEERFSLLMQQSPSVIELYNLDGLQISVNKAYEKLWGFPASRTLNKFNVLESKEVKDTGLFKYVSQAYNGESVSVPEYEFDSSGATEAKGVGRKRWLSTKIYPLKDANEKVSNIVITHEDITERKLVEEKLINRNKELETWSDVTVGRELKMLELKKEINELLEDIGKKPKYEIPI